MFCRADDWTAWHLLFFNQLFLMHRGTAVTFRPDNKTTNMLNNINFATNFQYLSVNKIFHCVLWMDGNHLDRLIIMGIWELADYSMLCLIGVSNRVSDNRDSLFHISTTH